DNTGISRLHGQPEVRTIGARAIRLYPLYHPAAALYTPSTLEVLRADFHRIPALLAQGAPEQPVFEDEEVHEVHEVPEVAEDGVADPSEGRSTAPENDDPDPDAPESRPDSGESAETIQLGLF
ncbi:MAG TPA: hypothetical protein VGF68_11665, partial [Solirubrobacteraceae bacterium]